MTDLNKLADELEGLAFDVSDDGPTKNETLALTAALIGNLPALLSALRSAGKMREALEEARPCILGCFPKCETPYKDEDCCVARAALKTEGE